jgi:hypothetical protein
VRWSVSLKAEGDRAMNREEILALADAVAPYEGIASGIGTTSYAAQIVVEAATSTEALERAKKLFQAAASQAGLPPWPTVWALPISEESGFEDLA